MFLHFWGVEEREVLFSKKQLCFNPLVYWASQNFPSFLVNYTDSGKWRKEISYLGASSTMSSLFHISPLHRKHYYPSSNIWAGYLNWGNIPFTAQAALCSRGGE